MATFGRQRPATWFWIVSGVLLLWAAAGAFACYAHMTTDAKALAAMSAYDRAYFQALPGWFGMSFVLATVPAVAGAAALLMRSKLAFPLYVLSLIGVVIQFGYVLGATDIIAVKGAVTAIAFPLFILVMCLFQLWFTRMAIRRGWLA